jgi:hypothetical protein
MTEQYYAAWLPRPIPSRVRTLPVDSAGKPIPYFVQRDEFGKPVASTVDGARLIQCLRYHRCYFCGDLMGRTVAYHARVSTGVSRIVPEPAMHVDCAEWAACAFRPVIAEPVLVWITSDGFQVLRMDERGALLRIGTPHTIKAFASNREATPSEVREALNRDLPKIRAIATQHNIPDRVEQQIRDFEQTLARAGVGYIVLQ